ncbi:hypothetical protein CONLIGDRAFT_649837 [Coniochaeta ligniaria NRRL 30616]|uniref:Uncharacterized protein n=1 Tax=Coniochaeta ligniaria NRRL 30616 TaxID=1408157 RepID=A0A1J7J742_9PEZI|nr:hypothetical protein CONLIGDRAFT_649837 [Coniochaeta ligniaria NRRL 30616]
MFLLVALAPSIDLHNYPNAPPPPHFQVTILRRHSLLLEAIPYLVRNYTSIFTGCSAIMAGGPITGVWIPPRLWEHAPSSPSPPSPTSGSRVSLPPTKEVPHVKLIVTTMEEDARRLSYRPLPNFYIKDDAYGHIGTLMDLDPTDDPGEMPPLIGGGEEGAGDGNSSWRRQTKTASRNKTRRWRLSPEMMQSEEARALLKFFEEGGMFADSHYGEPLNAQPRRLYRHYPESRPVPSPDLVPTTDLVRIRDLIHPRSRPIPDLNLSRMPSGLNSGSRPVPPGYRLVSTPDLVPSLPGTVRSQLRISSGPNFGYRPVPPGPSGPNSESRPVSSSDIVRS